MAQLINQSDGDKSLTTRPGSVYKSRGYWFAMIPYYDECGRYRRKSRSSRVKAMDGSNKGKGAAEAFLRSWQKDFDAQFDELRRKREIGERTGGLSSDMSLDEYSAVLIDRFSRDGHASSTVHGYETCRRRMLSYDISDRTLGDVSRMVPTEISDVYARLAESGLSPVTIRNTYVFLKLVLNCAVKDGLVTRNSFKETPPMRVRKSAPNALSTESRDATLEMLFGLLEVEGYDCPRQLIYWFIVSIMTGMRRGEVAGLRWLDVSFADGIINVRHALTPMLANGRTTGWELSYPKNDSSIRCIPMGDALSHCLGRLRDETMALRRTVGIAWDEKAFVFGDPINGRWRDPGSATKRWARVAKDLRLMGTQGRPPTLHDLRHTFATVALAKGVDVKTVSALLGHASTQMTVDTYADALIASKRAAMSRVEPDRLRSIGRHPVERVGVDGSHVGEPPNEGAETEPTPKACQAGLRLV